MYLGRFCQDEPNEVFWMCEQCKEDMSAWIKEGVIFLIGEHQDIEEAERMVN
jgi:hypothetical protein